MITMADRLIKQGKKEGIIVGEKKGKNELRIDLAKEMLRDNLPIDTIIKYTKLTAKQLASLSKPVAPTTH